MVESINNKVYHLSFRISYLQPFKDIAVNDFFEEIEYKFPVEVREANKVDERRRDFRADNLMF